MEQDITISEYNNLDEAEQYEAIWQHGFMIGKKFEGEYEITLFRLFSFYVEAYYSMALEALIWLKVISNIESLDSYKKFHAFKPHS
jgi:hypothetical protein